MAELRLADGQSLFYELLGEGPPLVLIPGLGGVSGFWRKLTPELARHFTLVLYDHRGCGRSSRQPGVFSVDQMADDLRQLLAELGIEGARAIGHSTGGAILQTLALSQPRCVERLFLSATWCGPDPYLTALFKSRKAILEAGGLALYRRASTFFLRPPQYLRDHPEELSENVQADGDEATEAAILAARLDALIAFDRRAEIAGIGQPVRLLCARDDMVTPPFLAKEIAGLIPGAEMLELDYGGHFTPLVAPDAFLEASLPFLLN